MISLYLQQSDYPLSNVISLPNLLQVFSMYAQTIWGELLPYFLYQGHSKFLSQVSTLVKKVTTKYIKSQNKNILHNLCTQEEQGYLFSLDFFFSLSLFHT